MLLLDGGMPQLDPEKLKQLASPRHLFQTVIVLPNRANDSENLRWAGWEIVRLEKGRNGAVIRQGPS